MKGFFFHTVVLLLLTGVAVAQESRTEQAYVHHELARQLADTLPDSALQYANKAELELVKDDPGKQLASLYDLKGQIYRDLGAKERSMAYYRKAYEAFIREENQAEIGRLAQELGNMYYDVGSFSEAYSYFMQSLHAFESENDIQGIASMENNLGLIAHEMGKLEEARVHYERAYKIYLDEASLSEQCQSLNNIGTIYYDKASLDTALRYFNEALEMVDETSDEEKMKKYLRSGLMNNIALVHSDQGEHQNALRYLLRCLSLSEEIGDAYHSASLYVNLGATYSDLANQDSALYFFHRALRLSEKENFRHVLMEVYDELAQHHARAGSYASAYNWRLRHDTLNKVIFNENQSKMIAQLRARYEQEISDRRIEQLHAESKVQRSLNKVFIVSILIIALLMALIAINLRAKNRANAQLARQNEKLSEAMMRLSESEGELQQQNRAKDRIFTVVAHDLRNPVAAVSGFSELLFENFDQFTIDSQKEYLHQIAQGSQRVLGLLENLLIWARSQMNTIRFEPKECRIDELVGNCVKELKASLDFKNIECQQEINSNCTVFGDWDMLTIVCRNLVGNAIKYSFPGGKIRISTDGDDAYCRIRVSDDGIGIQPEILEKLFLSSEGISSPGTAGEPGSGLGLVICKDFVEQNGGTIAAESESGNGSTFTLQLPISSADR